MQGLHPAQPTTVHLPSVTTAFTVGVSAFYSKIRARAFQSLPSYKTLKDLHQLFVDRFLNVSVRSILYKPGGMSLFTGSRC